MTVVSDYKMSLKTDMARNWDVSGKVKNCKTKFGGSLFCVKWYMHLFVTVI